MSTTAPKRMPANREARDPGRWGRTPRFPTGPDRFRRRSVATAATAGKRPPRPGRAFRARATGAAVLIVLALAVTGLPAGALHAGEGGPRRGRLPLGEDLSPRVSPEDRCPVCGMKVIRYPRFSAAIRLRNGDTFYFCDTGCMIRSWLHPEIYLGVRPAALERPVVREYFTGRAMDAHDAVFVYGSDVIGPMGPASVPVAGEEALEVFRKRHGGRGTFTLEGLDDAEWSRIIGRKPAPSE